MTLQEQYNAIKEGKGNKSKFLREAKRNHNSIISNINTYSEAVDILKNKSIISENTYYADLQPITQFQPTNRQPFEKAFSKFLEEQSKRESDEAVKVEEKKTSKTVDEVNDHNYDYSDPKNVNNQIGQEVLNGIYMEVQKNPQITQEAAMKEVMKNLAKDKLYYVKEGQFGVEGLGYEEQKSEMATGNHKASGYSDKIGEAVDQVLKEGFEIGGVVTTAHPDSMASRQNAVVRDMMNELDGKEEELEEVVGMSMDAENDYAEEMSNDMPADEHNQHMEEEEIIDEEPESEIKEKMRSKKKSNSLQHRLKEIENVGTSLALEAKIEAIEEEIFERTQRLQMLDENDAMSSLVDPKKVKMIRNEIKLLEKTKKRYAKMHEKASKQSKNNDE